MSLDQYGDVLNATNPGRITAWPTNPARTTWTQRIAGWIGLDPQTEHVGATDTWSPADDLAAGVHHPDRIRKVDPLHGLTPAGFQYATGTEEQVHAGPDDATGIWETPQPEPFGAIAAVPYQLVAVPHLGELPIGPLEPAHIHDQLIGAGL